MDADLLDRLRRQSLRDARGCLVWAKAKNSDGYGLLWHDGKCARVHRLAWAAAYGPIPVGIQVCHHCDVPACIELTHLFLGTNADNIADKVAKGRQAKAAKAVSGLARLTPEQVYAIRDDRRPLKTVAADFGICRQTVSSIRSRRFWGHL